MKNPHYFIIIISVIFIGLISAVHSIELDVPIQLSPSLSAYLYSINVSIVGITVVDVNETCVIINETSFCDIVSGTEWISSAGAGFSQLSIAVLPGLTWASISCNATSISPPYTYGLSIRDAKYLNNWGSVNNLSSCVYTFGNLYDHAWYIAYMNVTDSLGTKDTLSFTFYTRPYKYKIGVHVGP